MKVSSFMPAVTQMIYDMNLQKYLDGITFGMSTNCLERKASSRKTVYWKTKTIQAMKSTEFFLKSKATGESLYFVNEPVLESIAPDIIFTQDRV